MSWDFFKSKLENIDYEACSNELVALFDSLSPKEEDVQTFHISNNDIINKCCEPTIEKTSQMIYNFLTYIYQRNILTSLVKYILLKPLLTKFEKIQASMQNKKKGIFFIMQKRLNEIIFECILTAFNGSNYDNFLLCNNLIIIQTKLNEKIKIYKKGAAISTIYLSFRNNLNRLNNITKHSHIDGSLPGKIKKSKIDNKWSLNLYIKDIRNLVAANMSLDKIGKLFNLKVSKLCFPYNQADSIKSLKRLNSLKPYDDQFWKDNFSNKKIPLDERVQAQTLFEMKKFENLYQFGNHYLIQDCLLLHSIVLTLFNTYLKEDINLFIRRNYSQSSLSYQQFFIIEPSKQIKQNNAPKSINNIFFNYFIKQAVTGGLCTSFVHGNINENTIINEHLNYIEDPMLNPNTWPNFKNIQPWKKAFCNTPSGISTLDIRSLYPSAAIKRMPVNSPLFYSRFIPEDFQRINKQKLTTLNLQGFCENVRERGCHNKDIFTLLNTPPLFFTEFYALEYYLSSLPRNIQILRFQTNFTALGQIYLYDYPIDGFLSFYSLSDKVIHIKIIQYNSVYYHGHYPKCKIQNNEAEQQKYEKSSDIKNKILRICHDFKSIFNLSDIQFEYVEIWDCDFYMHKVPKCDFLFSFKKTYSYNSFLQNILNKKLTGFLTVKNLEIKKTNQNPLFGFLIQKVEYDLKVLSPYTQNELKHFSSSKRVIGLNKSKSFMVISTEYFNWIYKTFGFENTPDIYHALLFQTEYYLKPYIETKLLLRKELKELIKKEQNIEIRQNYEVKSELIKLMLNSCYGFTLCNVASSKFKCFENRKKCPALKQRLAKINSCIQINTNVYLVEIKKNIKDPFQTLLGHIGSYILFHSKIILIKRLYFLLKHLNPTKSQLLYMDTDSAHFLLQNRNFLDNIDDNLKQSFSNSFNKHFEQGNKLSGIWVEEGFFEMAEYKGEKSYKLYNKSNDQYITHMKGLNTFFQTKYVTEHIETKINPFISYNIFFKSPDFTLFKTYMTKDLFSNYVPVKRYFISATGSLPLKF